MLEEEVFELGAPEDFVMEDEGDGTQSHADLEFKLPLLHTLMETVQGRSAEIILYAHVIREPKDGGGSCYIKFNHNPEYDMNDTEPGIALPEDIKIEGLAPFIAKRNARRVLESLGYDLVQV